MSSKRPAPASRHASPHRRLSRREPGVRGWLARLPAPAIALIVAVPALLLFGMIAVLASILNDVPPPHELAKAPLAQSTHVVARDGTTLLYQFETERRELVALDQVPQVLVDATLAAEDKSFWTNPGVDLWGTMRAVVSGVIGREFRSGGSTITQQLVKRRIVGGERSIQRKIREAYLAIRVTQTFSKEQILELYFNQIYYGNQAYGVKAAAETYFGKSDLATLTLAEAALLAGLPQAPSVLDPSKEQNVERAKGRRAYVLEQMESAGMIDHATRAKADAEPIKTAGERIATIRAPHFVFKVRDQLTGILDGDEAAVTTGGYKVTTTLDVPKQDAAEEQVRSWVAQLKNRNVNNAALVSIDPRSGEVLAYVGSVDYQQRTDPKAQGQFDAAGIGVRQPGSAFKPFNYVTALKKGATAATVVVDARTDFGGGYSPENADEQYHGPVTMRQALRESRNVPAVKFQQHYSGTADVVATARDMGITTAIDGNKAGLALTLGAQEVKLVDMTSAYGTFATLGVRIAPTYILKVEDARGRVVWEHKDYEKKRVLDEGVAWIMTDILKDTTQPAGSFVFGPWTNIGRPAALKTGTTNDLKDVYAVGYVPTLATGVWMGNSNAEPMSARDFSSAMGPGQLWREYMKAALKDTPVADWPRPASIVTAEVAVAPGPLGGYGSGMLTTERTPKMTEFFVRGTQPTRPDDWYVEGCPAPDGTKKVGMRIREPEIATWRAATERWIREARAGQHSYGRYTWNLVSSDPCPSPSPSPSVSPTPSPARPSISVVPSPSLPVPTPPRTVVPSVPLLTPTPAPTPAPTPTPTRRP